MPAGACSDTNGNVQSAVQQRTTGHSELEICVPGRFYKTSSLQENKPPRLPVEDLESIRTTFMNLLTPSISIY
jgi:hypothetical protein